MKVTADQAINVLITLIGEDRDEVRSLRNRLTNILTALVVASFAITAFFLNSGTKLPKDASIAIYAVIIDILIILVMAFVFWRLKVDLLYARSALEAREDILSAVQVTSELTEIHPFPKFNRDPRIRDTDMWWVVAFSGSVVLLKTIFIWVILT